MSSNPAEPDKYSLDDMLERLQGKPAPDASDAGELVTRADGTQAIKVRKRKRRSVQAHKEEAKRNMRLRAIQVSSAVILIILIGLTFGALIIYANSAPYRKALLSKFNTATGANTEFTQLRVTPTGSSAAQANFQWPDGNLIKGFSLTNVSAKALLGGILGGHWGVDEISASTGTLRIGAQKPGEPLRYTPKSSAKSPVSFKRMAVGRLDMLVGDPTDPSLSLTQTEATFYPDDAGGKPSVRLFRGNAKIPGWPLFRLDRSLLEIKGDKVDIITLRLLHELDNTGNLELSGTLDPHALATEQKLGVKLSSFNLNSLAGTSLGHLIAGRIDSQDTLGDNHLAFAAKSGGNLKVAFTSSPNTFPKLNSFPFLGKLSKLTDNPWFVEPLFHDGCTGILERDADSIRIRNFSILSRTQLWVTGDLTIQSNDVLSGTVKIGLPEATIAGATNPRLKEIFADNQDGFRWISLKISGTGSRPVDNFDEIAGAAKASPDSQSGDAFDNLTRPKGQ